MRPVPYRIRNQKWSDSVVYELISELVPDLFFVGGKSSAKSLHLVRIAEYPPQKRRNGRQLTGRLHNPTCLPLRHLASSSWLSDRRIRSSYLNVTSENLLFDAGAGSLSGRLLIIRVALGGTKAML